MSTSPEAAPVLPCGCTIEQGDKMQSSVYWNSFNRVVQCHKCGTVYQPPAAATAKLVKDRDDWRESAAGCEQQSSAATPEPESLMTPEQAEKHKQNCEKFFDTMRTANEKWEATTPDVEKIAREHAYNFRHKWLSGAAPQVLNQLTREFDSALARARAPLVAAVERLFALVDASHYERAKAVRDAALTGTAERV